MSVYQNRNRLLDSYSNKNHPHIMFQKWIHPLAKLQTIKYNNSKTDIEYQEYENDSDENEYEDENNIKLNTQEIAEAMGLSDFNFYIGHTDFKINQNILNIIDDIDGVETLEQYTPYRIRISIGELFEDKRVIHDISVRISEYLKNMSKIQNS